MDQSDQDPEHVDVLVIGAGISGIGAVHHLRERHPQRSIAVVEARERAGGTWDLFRYPGARSDSDLLTFGYEFKPWRREETIADAGLIREYLQETLQETGLADEVRYRHRVVAASWSSGDARWTVTLQRPDGTTGVLTAGWIFCGTGYYRYDEGHTPDFAGRERFAGRVVHPQHWPEDLDVTGARVVVVGSGATAVTLVPALAGTAEHVTMLQRTPTYVLPVPRVDVVARALQRWLGPDRGYALARRKNIAQQRALWTFCRRHPRAARAAIRRINVRQLPPGFDVDRHFSPPYDPWDQRLCVVPDGDFFAALRGGGADVVTDRIVRFTPTGLELASGRHLDADVVVTATGLRLQVAGGIDLQVDGRPVSLPDTTVHRGTMLSGVPNLSLAIGYVNASWTLKIGVLCEYLCQVLTHLDEHGYDTATVTAEPGQPTRPLLDFGAGYVQRSLDELPRQGPRAPWLMSLDPREDRRLLAGPVVSEGLHFSGPRTRSPQEVTA